MTIEEAAVSAAAVMEFSAGAARGHQAAAVEQAEQDARLGMLTSPVLAVRTGVR